MFEYIKNRELDNLFRLTAAAFQCEVPELRGLPFAERLSKYAEFTKEQAEKLLKSEGLPDKKMEKVKAVEERLYQNSFQLGKSLQKRLLVRTRAQEIWVLRMAYKIIGIDFQCRKPIDRGNGSPDWSQTGEFEFVIKECYFSRYYSVEICRLISSLDEGLVAGLCGGSRLCFTQRITEGCNCCRGYMGDRS